MGLLLFFKLLLARMAVEPPHRCMVRVNAREWSLTTKAAGAVLCAAAGQTRAVVATDLRKFCKSTMPPEKVQSTGASRDTADGAPRHGGRPGTRAWAQAHPTADGTATLTLTLTLTQIRTVAA